MKVMKNYKTKAKWALGTCNNLPVLGFYSDGEPAPYFRRKTKHVMMDAGTNILMQGYIRPNTVGRGRSSVTFYFEDSDGYSFAFSAKGTYLLLEMIASGDIEVNTATGEYFGWWTCAKQGTEVSIIPVTKAQAAEIMS